MAPKLNQVLSTLIFISIILNFLAPATSQDCPYPCYPPPTATGNNPPMPPATTTTPPYQTGSYPPPGFYSPPSGNLPYSPPYLGTAPPSTDPMVPWFPYYYRKPPHQSDQSSSATFVRGSTVVTVLTYLFGFPLLSLLES